MNAGGLEYKGYTGVAEIDLESGELIGRVLGIRDMVTFVGRTVEELRRSFEESLDFYLEMCAEDGVEPQRPYSGKFLVRIPPELHRRVAIQAERAGTSLNDVAVRVLSEYADRAEAGGPSNVPPRAPRKGAKPSGHARAKPMKGAGGKP